MPKLGDYIGHLLSEITQARMHADVEAVKIAEFYADHPLLKAMPVPRFRMPDVEIEVPVVIHDMEESGGNSPQGTPTVAEIREVFDKVLASILTKERISLSATNKKQLKDVLDRRSAALTRPPVISLSSTQVTNDFVQNTLKTIGKAVKDDKKTDFEENLWDSLRVELLKIQKVPPRLNVLVTTAEVREAGPNEVITRLRLKISEEAFEWTTIDTDTESKDRLIIE